MNFAVVRIDELLMFNTLYIIILRCSVNLHALGIVRNLDIDVAIVTVPCDNSDVAYCCRGGIANKILKPLRSSLCLQLHGF